jgi:hypothetical protein
VLLQGPPRRGGPLPAHGDERGRDRHRRRARDPALGRLPLVFDFYRSIDELDLGETMGKEKKQKITLDLRQEADERRSVFFHRLAELGVSFAAIVEGGESNTMFRELWRSSGRPRSRPS